MALKFCRRNSEMTEEMKIAQEKCIQAEKRAAGKLYCPGVFLEEMFWARDKCLELDNIPYAEFDRRVKLIHELFGSVGKNVFVERGFKCEQGKNIHVGDNFYCNFNCTIYDSYTVTIGNNVMIGPNVTICTATHPVEKALRLDPNQSEYAKPLPNACRRAILISSTCATIWNVTPWRRPASPRIYILPTTDWNW